MTVVRVRSAMWLLLATCLVLAGCEEFQRTIPPAAPPASHDPEAPVGSIEVPPPIR
jgi:hypothetical protein